MLSIGIDATNVRKFVSGASYFIELVAVYAANPTKFSHYKAFRYFLELIANFNELKVKLEDGYEWDRLCVHDTIHFAPYVIDPTNHYNNLATNFSVNMRNELMEHAQDSLENFENCVAELF